MYTKKRERSVAKGKTPTHVTHLYVGWKDGYIFQSFARYITLSSRSVAPTGPSDNIVRTPGCNE